MHRSHPSRVLPDQALADLADRGVVGGAPLAPGQIQPASMDLRLGDHAYRLRSSFLPGLGNSVGSKLPDLAMHRIDIREGAVLETGAVYLVPLLETLRLPPDLSARANPKSSTGRIDVFVRLIHDGADAFDRVPPGYDGPLWLEVSPMTFPVLVRRGSRLAQLRVSSGSGRLADAEISTLRVVEGGEPVLRDGLCFTVDLEIGGERGPCGYRARRHAGVVDVDRIGELDPEHFWEPVRARNSGLVLDPGEFYILASREHIVIPPDHAAEMIPFDAGMGEFRVHYAGFFDPGFSARGVLEIRSHDVPFLLEHGQPAGRLAFERLSAPSRALYGRGISSNYAGQGLRLSKHFRAPS